MMIELCCLVLSVVVLVASFRYLQHKYHPLRSIPEPWGWPILKHFPHFWRSDHLDVYERLSRPYKSVGLFRISNLTLPEQVVLLDPEYPKHVFSRPDLFVRSDLLEKACPFFAKGLLSAKGEEHRWQKSVLSRAFTPEKQRVYVEVGNKFAERFVQSWSLKVGSVLEDGMNIAVLQPLQNLTFQVMCEASCSWATSASSEGESTNQPKEEEEKFVKACKTILDLITSGSNSKLLFRLLPFLDRLPFGPGRKKKEAIETAHQEIVKIMAKRKAEIQSGAIPANDDRDFLSLMFRAQKEDGRMTDDNIHDNIFTFLLGAFETTSTALMWCLYVFGIYPDVQEKARNEVIAALGSQSFVNIEDISRLKYLTNVIRETLRVYNSSIRVGRVTTQPCNIGPFRLPKGQMIKTVFNLFHMNKDLFPQPKEFKPERFEDEGHIKPGSWLAFGYGPYSCIGKKFAMNEMRVILAKLLQKFSFSVDPDKRRFKRSIQVAVRATPDIEVRVTRLG